MLLGSMYTMSKVQGNRHKEDRGSMKQHLLLSRFKICCRVLQRLRLCVHLGMAVYAETPYGQHASRDHLYRHCILLSCIRTQYLSEDAVPLICDFLYKPYASLPAALLQGVANLAHVLACLLKLPMPAGMLRTSNCVKNCVPHDAPRLSLVSPINNGASAVVHEGFASCF